MITEWRTVKTPPLCYGEEFYGKALCADWKLDERLSLTPVRKGFARTIWQFNPISERAERWLYIQCEEWWEIYLVFFFFSFISVALELIDQRNVDRPLSRGFWRSSISREGQKEAVERTSAKATIANIRTQRGRCIYRVHYWINIKNGNIRRNVNSEICGDKWFYHTSILAKRPKRLPAGHERRARAWRKRIEKKKKKKQKQKGGTERSQTVMSPRSVPIEYRRIGTDAFISLSFRVASTMTNY